MLQVRRYSGTKEGILRQLSVVAFLLFFLLSAPSLSFAGAIKVMPTKLFLAGGKKTEVLKVINEGDAKVTIQVEAMKWTQDEKGKDIYEPTEDIAFFPKIFTVEKGKETLLRIGAKERRSGERELSYRVFLQEIPVSKPGETRLTLALRISVPVFIRPVKEVKEWGIEKLELSGGVLLVKVKNSGSSHISVGKMKAKGVDASNQEAFQKEESGWYVLPGVTRTFGIKIPGNECLKSSSIMVSAESGESKKESKLDVDKSQCPKEAQEPAATDKGGKQ
jgi:fimbrial chaperone protein